MYMVWVNIIDLFGKKDRKHSIIKITYYTLILKVLIKLHYLVNIVNIL